MRFIDKSLQIILPTGWVPGLLVSIYINFIVCNRPLQLPTARERPVNNPKQAVKHPWTIRERPVNHPWTTQEPPVNHPWTTRETSVLETQKTGLETRKTDFVPWATRETPVKHPWSTRERSGDAQWTCINGQMVSIFLQVPNIKCSLS